MSGTFSTRLSEPNQIGDLTPWELDFRQISRGSAETDLSVRVGQSMSALSIAMGNDVHQIGAAPADLITVGLPMSGALSRWMGEGTPRNALVSFGSGHEFEGVSRAGFKAVTLSFSKDALVGIADDFGLELKDDLERPGVFDLGDGRRTAQLLTRKTQAFLSQDAPQWDAEAEEDICLALLLAAVSAPLRHPTGRKRLRDRALRRALEVIETHADRAPTIRELCKTSGASWPTLHRAFVDQFGIGPKAYLSNLRLTRARRALLAAQGDVKIADVANNLGFWHMGQFAQDYRKLFNRLPSDDLNARHRTATRRPPHKKTG